MIKKYLQLEIAPWFDLLYIVFENAQTYNRLNAYIWQLTKERIDQLQPTRTELSVNIKHNIHTLTHVTNQHKGRRYMLMYNTLHMTAHYE